MTELPAYICSDIYLETHAVLLVSHAGGDWQFLCGAGHESNEVPKVVGLNHMLDKDPSLRDVMDLPKDWDAQRVNVGEPWVRTPSAEERW